MSEEDTLVWGTELWDRYDSVVHQVNHNTKELSSFYGKFLKERGRIEGEYARAIRGLIKSFTPKINKKGLGEDTSQTKGFRLLLTELGYQAGQHELLSDSYGKTAVKMVSDKVKQVKKEVESQQKEAKEFERLLNLSYKDLDDAKLKYQKSHVELEITTNTFKRTETDLSLSRNEVERMRGLSNRKTREMDERKAQYAHQLIKTNESQHEYYYSQLPSVFDSLQSLTASTCQFLKEVLELCVSSEVEVAPIVARCHEEMKTVIQNISVGRDSDIVVDRFKTGNVPPDEFVFEELQIGEGESNLKKPTGTLTRATSRQNLNHVDKKGNTNYFQRKRELEKKIEVQENEVSKGKKEVAALRVMVDTYTNNPTFGDVKKFQGELDTAEHKVQILVSDLHTFKSELADTITRLESLKNGGGRSRDKSPSGSLDSSLYSGSMLRASSTTSSQGSDNESQASATRGPDSGIFLTPGDPVGGNTSPAILGDFEEEDEEDYETVKTVMAPPPPPPPPLDINLDTPSSVDEVRVVALYNFDGEAESNIAMMEGEEFFVTEPDLDGWIKVKRVDNSYYDDVGEGYVPTSFVQFV